ncbi:hypothetical protein PENVUL_c004G01449 [Penicillium vulpinum]|uniref:Uncharacterized protein n=1 Tax=Penicillium vulpinum TaxID=29845 RepID=A0A1V6S7Y0_9EURO|nr:hypothetical protein PENVUL_c004G01449 [Penicillium vulpinum]
MISPSKVCYITPLNVVSKRDKYLYGPPSIQAASFDELLQPCDFDCPEEAEEAENSSSSPMAAPENSLDSSLPKAKWNKPFPDINYILTPHFEPSLPTIYEENWNERWGWLYGTGNTTASSPSNEIWAESDDTLPANFRVMTDLARMTSSTGKKRHPTRNPKPIQSHNKLSTKSFLIVSLGLNATCPSDSLAIILAKPKPPKRDSDFRIQLLLGRAAQFIDPILVTLNGAEDGLLDLRGSQLVRESTGRVFKFYSPHGKWLEDPNDTSEDTTTDVGNLRVYDTAELAIGNGFVESSAIPSVSK